MVQFVIRIAQCFTGISIIGEIYQLIFLFSSPDYRVCANQAQSARICRAFFTSSSEPAQSTFNLPDFRVTEILMVVKPLFFIRKRICLLASLAP